MNFFNVKSLFVAVTLFAGSAVLAEAEQTAVLAHVADQSKQVEVSAKATDENLSLRSVDAANNDADSEESVDADNSDADDSSEVVKEASKLAALSGLVTAVGSQAGNLKEALNNFRKEHPKLAGAAAVTAAVALVATVYEVLIAEREEAEAGLEL